MATVVEIFSDCCKTAGVRFKPMALEHQKVANTVQRVSDSSGVCFALTLLWLSRYFKALIVDDDGKHFGEIVGAINSNPRMAMVLRQIQQSETSRGDLFGKGLANLRDTSRTEEARMKTMNSIFDRIGFKSIYTEGLAALGVRPTHFRTDTISAEDSDFFCCKDEQPPYNRMRRFVTLNEGITLIKLQTHYVGVISDHGRKKYKFLDVNAGQAITDDLLKFRTFMSLYLASEITKHYTKKTQVIHAVQSY